MTDRRHMDPNLMGPSGLELASNEACRAEVFLESPTGRGVPTALLSEDRHFLPMARIAADGCCDLSCGHVEAPPNQGQIFARERAAAAMVCEEFGQAPMRCVSLSDDQKTRCVLVQAVHDSRPLDPADAR